MRFEQDGVGVSLFVEQGLQGSKLLGGLALPGLILLLFGLFASLVGLEWAGPALLFVGIGMCISVPLTMDDPPRDLCTYLRFDHLGVRANGRRLSSSARIEELEHGVRLHDAETIYLPVADPEDRRALIGLLERALRSGDGAPSLPDDLLRLLAVPAEVRDRSAVLSNL